MAEDASGTGAAAGTGTLVIPGEMAARVDRLPRSFMAWEICLLVQVGWAIAASTDGIAARMYPYVWLPAKEITHSQYDVLYAFQVGISIVIGGYALGWLADKIGRRKALILSAALAGVFIWPFAYVTNYPALIFLSIADTLGFAGFLAINVVYMSEIMGPTVRPRIMMISQVAAIFVLLVILTGIIPHYWFPSQYRLYLWVLAGLNILVAIALYFRMPESPRWLEARERRDEARKVMESMEARVMKRHPVLPEPDLAPHEVVAEEKTSWLAPFGKNYLFVTILLLVVMALGYAGVVYGAASQSFLFLSLSRGYSAGFVFALVSWSGVVSSVVYLLNAFIGGRFERRWVQLFGAVLFAGGWWGVLRDTQHRGHGHHVPHCGRRRHLVAVEHVRVHPQQLPDPDALAGYRLDRRHRPPRRLGRCPDRRPALPGDRAAELHPVRHDPVRAAPRRPSRDLREEPAPPRAGRTVPIAAGPPAG